MLDALAPISGLRINYEKTEILWIVSLRVEKKEIIIGQSTVQAAQKVYALGVWFCISVPGGSKLLNDKEEKVISNAINNWYLRRLTLLGKITAIMSLWASQLVYLGSPFPLRSEHLKEINLFYQFLWDGKPDKIRRSEMINVYSSGGLKMLDIQAFYCVLKTKWIQKCLDFNNKGKWKLFLDFFLKRYNVNVLFMGNLNERDAASLDIEDLFAKELFEIWARLSFQKQPSNPFNLPIWYNSLIRIDNKPFFL